MPHLLHVLLHEDRYIIDEIRSARRRMFVRSDFLAVDEEADIRVRSDVGKAIGYNEVNINGRAWD